MSDDYVCYGDYDRQMEDAYHDRADREEREYFRNRSLKPSVLIDRLWCAMWDQYGKLRGWW